MTFEPLLLLLFFAHVIGDFYLQSDNMAQGKLSSDNKKSFPWLCRHSVYYTLVMAIALFVFFKFSLLVLVCFIFITISHIAIDYFKRYVPQKYKPFIVDQTIHITILIITWYILRDSVNLYTFVVNFNQTYFDRINVFNFNPHWNINPYWTVLGMLVVMRPIGYLIKSNELWDFGSMIEPNKPHAGRMIGYLERLIVFFLIVNNALATIGFVITAKSVIRYSEISKTNDEAKIRNQVEYFLIGTLMSMACVFVVHLLLQITHT